LSQDFRSLEVASAGAVKDHASKMETFDFGDLCLPALGLVESTERVVGPSCVREHFGTSQVLTC
jgi:hypothetical protein